MAHTTNETEELEKRCKRAGCDVTRSKDGMIKVKFPNRYDEEEKLVEIGKTVLIHRTPSDVRSMANLMSRLKAAGLEELEAKQAAADEAARRIRMKEDQEKAERKLAKAVASQPALAKASGPYQLPEEVPLSWFTQPHPMPWMRPVMMTPQIADTLLEDHNWDNRAWRVATREHYLRIIQAGDWKWTHQAVAMDTRAVVQDGQHRLWAVRASGVAVPMFVAVGMPQTNFKYIDEGANRKFADLLSIGKDQEIKHRGLVSSTVRMVRAFMDDAPRLRERERATNNQLHDVLMGDTDLLLQAVNYAATRYKTAYTPQTALSTAYYMVLRVNGAENRYAKAFFDGLVSGFKPSGMKLSDKDPRSWYRQHMLNRRNSTQRRLDTFSVICLLFKIWNYVIEDKQVDSHMRTTIQTTRANVLRDSGEDASTPPRFLADEVDAPAGDETKVA